MGRGLMAKISRGVILTPGSGAASRRSGRAVWHLAPQLHLAHPLLAQAELLAHLSEGHGAPFQLGVLLESSFGVPFGGVCKAEAHAQDAPLGVGK